MQQAYVDVKGKKGRPLKKDYDAETLMQELIDTVAVKVTAKLGCRTEKTTGSSQMQYYHVRKNWAAASQHGAYTMLENAKQMAYKNPGYTVFGWNGKAVYKAGGSARAGIGMTNADCPFMVKVSIPDLNIRVGARKGSEVDWWAVQR